MGALLAVAMLNNLRPVFLVVYVRFVQGRECWCGFSRAALSN